MKSTHPKPETAPQKQMSNEMRTYIKQLYSYSVFDSKSWARWRQFFRHSSSSHWSILHVIYIYTDIIVTASIISKTGLNMSHRVVRAKPSELCFFLLFTGYIFSSCLHVAYTLPTPCLRRCGVFLRGDYLSWFAYACLRLPVVFWFCLRGLRVLLLWAFCWS